MAKIKLSVVIIAHNEAESIPKCISSVLDIADEIVVIDSYSTDNTTEVVQQFKNVRVIQHAFEGYGPQKNFGNQQASFDMILSLDADEVVSAKLKEEIIKELNGDPWDVYLIPFDTYFCGKKIRFGHWHTRKSYRMFNKKIIQWDNNEVHEDLMIREGHKIKTLGGKILHYTIRSLDHYKSKNDLYIKLGIEKLLQKGKPIPLFKTYLSPWFRFFHSYILNMGILDGYYGYVIAKETARVTFEKYYKSSKTLNS